MHKGSGKSWRYHLIILNSVEGTVQIAAYDRDRFEQTVTAYGEVEAEAAQGKHIEPVLVSAGSIDNLRRAYPNFFLATVDFTKNVSDIISRVKH